MRRKICLGSILTVAVAVATYFAADNVSANPNSRFGRVARLAFRIGVKLSPLSAMPPVDQRPLGEARCDMGCSPSEECSARCPANCTSATVPAIAVEQVLETPSRPALFSEVLTIEASEMPENGIRQVETIGSILVVADTDESAAKALAVEVPAEDLQAIPPRPVDEGRPPAVMPYIEDEPAEHCDGCILSGCWQRFKAAVIGAVDQLRPTTWFGPCKTQQPQINAD